MCWPCAGRVLRAHLADARLQVELLRLDPPLKLRGVGRLWSRGRPRHRRVRQVVGRWRRRLQVHELVRQRVAHRTARREAGLGLRDFPAEALSQVGVPDLLLHLAALTAQANERTPLSALLSQGAPGWAAAHPQHRTSCGSKLPRGERLQFEPPSAKYSLVLYGCTPCLALLFVMAAVCCVHTRTASRNRENGELSTERSQKCKHV